MPKLELGHGRLGAHVGLMLLARWKRWWHVWYWFARPSTWKDCTHQEITHYVGWRTTRVRCECGKEWT
jgi:hypothetical protein